MPRRSDLRSILIGAAFLMATSAIGPGFITQTTSFTVELGAAFAFAIVISLLVSFTVTPMLAARWLRQRGQGPDRIRFVETQGR